MICPITGSEMRRLYRGPVRDGINGAYVMGSIWHNDELDMAMLEPSIAIEEQDYETDKYRMRLHQESPEMRRRQTDPEAFVNARYLFTSRGRACLDFGAGNGSFLDAMAMMFDTTYAVERSQSCKPLLERSGHIVLGEDWTSRVSDVDAVFCLQTLEHLKDWPQVFRQLAGVMAPKGVLGISVPRFSIGYVQGKPESWLRDYFVTHHLWYLSARAIIHIANSIGLLVAREHDANVGAQFDRTYLQFVRRDGL